MPPQIDDYDPAVFEAAVDQMFSRANIVDRRKTYTQGLATDSLTRVVLTQKRKDGAARRRIAIGRRKQERNMYA